MQFVLNDKAIEVDTCGAIKMLESLERAAGIRGSDGAIAPTKRLLELIVVALEKLGLKGCTLDSGYVFWRAVFAYANAKKEEHKINAEIAHWYGINPFSLSDAERVGLYGNIPRVTAQKQLAEGTYDPTDPQGLFDLTMRATDSIDAAREARAQAQERKLDQQLQRG